MKTRLNRSMSALAFVMPVFDLDLAPGGKDFLYVPTYDCPVTHWGFEWNYRRQTWEQVKRFGAHEDGVRWARKRHEELKAQLGIACD